MLSRHSTIITLLGILRVLICFWPQTGYLHPDEFFQSADIVAGHQLGAKIVPAWEFTTDKPIRCMLIPNLLNGIAFRIAKVIQLQPSAYLLLVAPRLIYTLTSFSIDYCLLLLCQCYSNKGLPYFPVSVIFQSSFICLGIFTRTLSNTIEALLLAWLLVVVCRIVRPSFRLRFITSSISKSIDKRITKSAQITSSLQVGSLVILGTFNRPTFPAFALVPCMYWLFESLKRNSYSMRLVVQRAALPLIISSLITFIIISYYDTVYYRGQSVVSETFDNLLQFKIDELYNNLKTNWVVTPFNFLLYNSNTANLSKYGIHLPITHSLVNMPLAFNLLAIIYYKKVMMLVSRSGLHHLLLTANPIKAMMIITTFISIVLLSLIPHQEFRFLAPLIIPLVYVCGSDIYTNKRLLGLWFVVNVILVYFYSRVHQSGVTNALLELDLTLKNLKDSRDDSLDISVIATKCYPVPTYAWNIVQDDARFNLDSSATVVVNLHDSLDDKLQPTLERLTADVDCTYDHKVFFMVPRLYVQRLVDHLTDHMNLKISVENVKNFTSHFSGEDFGESIGLIRKFGISAWNEAFGFSLVEIDLLNDRSKFVDE